MIEQELKIFKVFIEIEQGSNEKWEYDKKSKTLKLDFMFENLFFPYNYGFILNTKSGDGEEVDAIVLSGAPLKKHSVIDCKIIGMAEVIDRGEEDNKIICVPENDVLAEKFNDISDIPQNQIQEWKDFLANVAKQKKKDMKVIKFCNKQDSLYFLGFK